MCSSLGGVQEKKWAHIWARARCLCRVFTWRQEWHFTIKRLFIVLIMCYAFFFSVIYIDSFISPENTSAYEARPGWLVVSTLLYKLCEPLEDFKNVSNFTHLLFIDLCMPLTLYNHSRIRLTWVQVMDWRAHLVFLQGWVWRHGVSVTFTSPNSRLFHSSTDAYMLILICCFIVSICWRSTEQLYNHILWLWNLCEYKLVVVVQCIVAFCCCLLFVVVQLSGCTAYLHRLSPKTPLTWDFLCPRLIVGEVQCRMQRCYRTWVSCFND